MLEDGLLIRKVYMDALKEMTGDARTVKVVTGMRGAGKTTLMKQFLKSYSATHKVTVLDYDLDSAEFFTLRSANALHDRVIKDAKGQTRKIVVLHEVQKLQNWAQMVKELYEQEVGEIFITASDSGVMELREYEVLRDHVEEVRVTPLSLQEFMELNGFRSAKSALASYLEIGGLPAVRSNMPKEVAASILDGMFCSAILNDVLPYGGNLDATATVSTARYIMVNSGAPMGSDDLSDASGSSFHTASKILDAMASCYLVFENEGRSLFNRLTRSKIVYYSADLGLRNCVKGGKAKKVSLGENALMIELKRLGYNVRIEGEESDRTLEAQDDTGTTTYSVCAGKPTARSTDKRVYITMDETDTGSVRLSSYLAKDVES